MYVVKKRIEISAAHHLQLPYESPCNSLHGHNWLVWVSVESEEMNPLGMVIDFTILRDILTRRVVKILDHQDLNKILDNPTAENMARWISKEVDLELQHHCLVGCRVSRVEVQETEGNVAIWER